MDEIALNLIIILVVALFVGLLFVYLGYRKRQKRSRLVQAAKERGWEFEEVRQPLIFGYRFKGRSPFGTWSLETLATVSSKESGPGSSSTSFTTRWWHSGENLTSQTLVVGHLPSNNAAQLLQDFSNPLLQIGLRLMLGEDEDWISGLAPVDLTGKELGAGALCLAEPGLDASQWITPTMEKLLSSLPQKWKPVIKVREKKLEISLPTMQLLDPEDLDKVVNLGKSLLLSWQDA